MMVQANRIYILIIKVNKVFSFLSHCSLKQIEYMFSMFLSSYRNTRESLGEFDKAVETLADKKIKSKTMHWIKSKNCDIVEDK